MNPVCAMVFLLAPLNGSTPSVSVTLPMQDIVGIQKVDDLSTSIEFVDGNTLRVYVSHVEVLEKFDLCIDSFH